MVGGQDCSDGPLDHDTSSVDASPPSATLPPSSRHAARPFVSQIFYCADIVIRCRSLPVGKTRSWRAAYTPSYLVIAIAGRRRRTRLFILSYLSFFLAFFLLSPSVYCLCIFPPRVASSLRSLCPSPRGRHSLADDTCFVRGSIFRIDFTIRRCRCPPAV